MIISRELVRKSFVSGSRSLYFFLKFTLTQAIHNTAVARELGQLFELFVMQRNKECS